MARTLISAGRILAGQVTAVALEASADPAAFDQAALRFPAADIYELWAAVRPAAISAA